MGFETIGAGGGKSLNKLQAGEFVEGYLIGCVEEINKFNNKQWNLLMANEDGSEFKLFSSGTVKYFAKNFAMGTGKTALDPNFIQASNDAKACEGFWVRFTYESTKKNKTGQDVRQYRIQKDSDKVFNAKKPQESPTTGINHDALADIPF